jgi:hypothetical protein
VQATQQNSGTRIKTAGHRVSARHFTIFPHPGEILWYFSEDNMVYTKGQRISQSISFSYTEAIESGFMSYSKFTFMNGWDDYTWEDEEYVYNEVVLPMYTLSTNGTPPDFSWVTSYQTISVPKQFWGTDETETTQAFATLASILTSSTPAINSALFAYSWSNSKSYESTALVQPPFNTNTDAASYSQSESAFSESGKTITFFAPSTKTFSVFNPVYLVASSQRGAVVANIGFHTAPPSRSFQSSHVGNGRVPAYLGQARPGVSVFVPFVTPTPLHPEAPPVKYFTLFPWITRNRLSVALETVAHTTTVGSGVTITPSVAQISRLDQTNVETHTIRVQGEAGTYGTVVSYAGGYNEFKVTWSLVVGTPGLLIIYKGATSESSQFTAATTKTYAGRDGSFFSFIPNFFTSDNYLRVVSSPAYDYNEF